MYLTILGDLENTFLKRKNKTSVVPLCSYQKGRLMHHQLRNIHHTLKSFSCSSQKSSLHLLLFSLICSFHICLFWNSGCSLRISEKLRGWSCLSCVYIWGTTLLELLNIASKELSGIKRSRCDFKNYPLLSTFNMINKMCLQNTFWSFFLKTSQVQVGKLHTVTS